MARQDFKVVIWQNLQNLNEENVFGAIIGFFLRGKWLRERDEGVREGDKPFPKAHPNVITI